MLRCWPFAPQPPPAVLPTFFLYIIIPRLLLCSSACSCAATLLPALLPTLIQPFSCLLSCLLLCSHSPACTLCCTSYCHHDGTLYYPAVFSFRDHHTKTACTLHKIPYDGIRGLRVCSGTALHVTQAACRCELRLRGQPAVKFAITTSSSCGPGAARANTSDSSPQSPRKI